mgnify:CR=1 FL=1
MAGLARGDATIDIEQILKAPIRADAGRENSTIITAVVLRLRFEHYALKPKSTGYTGSTTVSGGTVSHTGTCTNASGETIACPRGH